MPSDGWLSLNPNCKSHLAAETASRNQHHPGATRHPSSTEEGSLLKPAGRVRRYSRDFLTASDARSTETVRYYVMLSSTIASRESAGNRQSGFSLCGADILDFGQESVCPLDRVNLGDDEQARGIQFAA